MRTNHLRALLWAIIFALAVGIITDWLVILGCARAWQYIYNFSAFCAIVALLVPALGDKLYER